MPRRSKGMTFVSAGVQGAGSRPGDEVATKGRGKVYAPRIPSVRDGRTRGRGRGGRGAIDGSWRRYDASARDERQGI